MAVQVLEFALGLTMVCYVQCRDGNCSIAPTSKFSSLERDLSISHSIGKFISPRPRDIYVCTQQIVCLLVFVHPRQIIGTPDFYISTGFQIFSIPGKFILTLRPPI